MSSHETHHPFPPRRVLITAGPTREPIDDVRFLGNRSSGALGIELARAAARLGLTTTLALGESIHNPNISGVVLARFDQAHDLEAVLSERMTKTDILVMAAAVADHTPRHRHAGKLSRRETGSTTIELVPTADLLAGASAAARPDQLLVGFALEPADRLEDSARRKLRGKKVDLIIANQLETMESDSISATLVAGPQLADLINQPPRPLTKTDFAAWLWPELLRLHRAKITP